MDGRRELIRVRNLEATRAFAKELARTLVPGDLLRVSGELGAGKTTFLKTVIATLTGLREQQITSPTFTYLQIYEQVCHFDLYRLHDASQFFELGFDHYIGAPWIALVEWPERVPQLQGKELKIEVIGPKERQFKLG